MKRLCIYCAGGLGRDMLKHAKRTNSIKKTWDGYLFIDDDPEIDIMDGIPVITFAQYLEQRSEDDEFVIMSGEHTAREAIDRKLQQNGCRLVKQYVAPDVYYDEYDELGEGCVVFFGGSFGANQKYGRCVWIGLQCIFGHDVELEDYVTCSHDVNISGGCHIGSGTYMGTGCIVKHGINIGRNCIIGMGALVLHDVPDNSVVYGSPARIVRENKGEHVFYKPAAEDPGYK